MSLLRRPTRVPIKGAVVLITGAGSGIGQLMAIECAKRGARVLVLWDIKDPADTAATIMREVGAGVVVRRDVVDVTADLHHTAQAVISEFGRVDILINNAGIVTGKNFLDLTDDDVERTFAVNTLSHYRTTREFLPGMLERDRGSVVTIASAAGLVGVARQTDYSASKFGAVGFAEVFACGATSPRFERPHPALLPVLYRHRYVRRRENEVRGRLADLEAIFCSEADYRRR